MTTRRYVATITAEASGVALVLTDAGSIVRAVRGLASPEDAADLAVRLARADTDYHGGLTDRFVVTVAI